MKKDLLIAQKFIQELKNVLGDDLVSSFFYGSRARGKPSVDSDLDLFLLLKEKPQYASPVEGKILDLVIKYLSKYDIYISVVTYGLADYKKYKNLSYLSEVRKGIKII